MSYLYNTPRTGARTAAPAYQNINTQGYHSRFFDADADHVLLDVRTEIEFAQMHLPGAINIPLDRLPARAGEVPTGKPVIVVCATGNRSIVGSQLLLQAGHTDVYNLQGGTMGWMMAGLPLEG